MRRGLIPLLLLALQIGYGQTRADRYTLILDEPPVVARMVKSGEGLRTRAAAAEADRLKASQQTLIERLAKQDVTVLGSTQYLVNAVFVSADRDSIAAIEAMPGVRHAYRMGTYKRSMNRAINLINGPQGWSLAGGMGNAGAGVKIAILDTGIDQTHPAFNDPSLQTPAGYPLCSGADCDYTSSKVIAARSYVDLLVLPDVPEISRPDDLSPRDRVGHGTAVAMVAAGNTSQGPLAAITGVAPKAYLGNYKIFGSPGVNDITFDNVVIEALTDAVLDGMDIAVLSLEGSGIAEWAPDDSGAACNLDPNVPCDPLAAAVDAAAGQISVVVAAGNDGDLSYTGSRYPAENSINSPGTAPSAITVGATTNSHLLFQTVEVTGDGVPQNLASIPVMFGDGPVPAAPLTAALSDVAASEPNALACTPVGTGTLIGTIAVVERGECGFETKIINLQKGGAVAAIIVQTDSDVLFPITDVANTTIPAVLMGATDAQNLRDYLAQNAGHSATLDPALKEFEAYADDIAYFSSRGPSIGNHGIKPEVVAVGTDLYMATQDYDANGEMWNPERYTAAQGTSFSAPMVAGAVALSLQVSPGLTPAELKSTVVNTAVPKQFLADFDESGAMVPVSVKAAGAGKLDVAGAVATTITAIPSTLAFGIVDGANLPARAVQFTNLSGDAVTLNLAVEPNDPRLTLSATSLNVPSGGVGQVVVSVNQLPPAGAHEGSIVVTGGSVTLRIPFLYLASDGIADNIVPVGGMDFVGNVDEWVDQRNYNLLFKVVDRFGIPLSSVPVRFRPTLGGGVIEEYTATTDGLGIAAATATLGPNPGEQEFIGEVLGGPDLNVYFAGRARLRPHISAVVDAASGQAGNGLAPGSYVSIYGTSLSDGTRVFDTPFRAASADGGKESVDIRGARRTIDPYLALSLAGVSVSFDVVGRNVSYPGRLHFVSEGQINVQVPWELAGENQVQMKVSTGPLTESPLFSVVLNNYSPDIFLIPDYGGTGRLVAAALDGDFHVVSSTNPVASGEVVQLYGNGIGPVDNPPPTGELTPGTGLIQTREKPTVTIGGQNAQVDFSGLAPGAIGLYQINAIVPAGLAPGLNEVVVTNGGVSSTPVSLYVGP